MPRKRAIPVTVSYSCNECGAPAYTSGPGQTSKIYVNHTKACKLALEIMLQWPQLAESTGLAKARLNDRRCRAGLFPSCNSAKH
jgi:hypothetical protein